MPVNLVNSNIPETSHQPSTSHSNEGKEGASSTADARGSTVDPYAALTQAGKSRQSKLLSASSQHWSDGYKRTNTKFSDFQVMQLIMQTIHDRKIADFVQQTKIHRDKFKRPTDAFRHAVTSIVILGLGQFAMDVEPGFHLWASDQSPLQLYELMQYYGKGRPFRKDIVVTRGKARSAKEGDISGEKYQFLFMFKREMGRELIKQSKPTFMLDEDASDEEVEKRLQDLEDPDYFQRLWDKSFADDDPDFGLNVDNMVKTMMGWGAKNSEIGTRYAMRILDLNIAAGEDVTRDEKSYMEALENFPGIAKELDKLGSFQNSRTLLQIIEALPKGTLAYPKSNIFWDIKESEKIVPPLIDAAQRVDAALKQAYENLNSKEISFVEFAVETVLSNLFEVT